jgi:chromate transporter
VKIYLFFTQAAFVTFGGAYAVLAYVNQVAVNDYGWITTQQAIDGFALAETTPGPLIMVLQFIGFIAGWNNTPENMHQTVFAVVCALLTTFATFLPSFLFIFAFAPFIEGLQKNEKLKSALASVTAAVVGVILTLAVTFGATVVFPHANLNWFGLSLGAAAFVVLFRFKIDVLWLILFGGLLGLSKAIWQINW